MGVHEELFDIRVLGELLTDGVFICDRDGVICYVNEKNETIAGISREQCIGKHIDEFINQDSRIENTLAKQLLKGENKMASIPTSPRQKGKILEYGSPIYSKSGEIIGAIIIDHDISQLLELEESLATSERHIHQLEKTNVQHELIIQHLNRQDYLSKITQWNSPKMREVVSTVISAAKTDVTILLEGDTGVGKEVLAQEIVTHSLRKNHPYIKLNCAAIPENLIESELFGYVKGAFTGANPRGKAGVFELANNGTLFLDEIGELPLDFQTKLLRAIQEKEITRIGSDKPTQVDFRLIAATNRNLQDMVKAGKFRADLFYRLNVVPVRVPPLKERPEDVMLLIRYFITKFESKYKKNLVFEPDVYRRMASYPWPGNIREMENLMERWFVLYPDKTVINWAGIQSAFLVAEDQSPYEGRSFEELTSDFQKSVITWSIGKYGSVRKAAVALQVHYSTLSKMCSRLKIDINALKL